MPDGGDGESDGVGVAILYLIRHDEPAVRGVFLGHLDPPLSAAGAAHAAQTLSGMDVKVVYCSTLRRARETADCIRGTRLMAMNELREIDYGAWMGKTWAEIVLGWPELAARKQEDWLGVSAAGGESWEELLARLRPVWETIRQGECPAAVVAHQGVNAALANLMDGRNPLEFSQEYGEVIRVEFE